MFCLADFWSGFDSSPPLPPAQVFGTVYPGPCVYAVRVLKQGLNTRLNFSVTILEKNVAGQPV